ncbi:MAG: dTMP kinase [Candidatus Zixiibacteriota bacterium]|nr:MAG: dTMP kinase [candidate division Zixibacteria bacterium]HDL03263.1 dTMP kinase [candidate division Zixibacteria bacterium]
MKRKGLFITFEGIDGCGKSTQLRLTNNYLKKLGFKPEILREPGSTILSEKIRKILLNKNVKISPISELMLYIAARAELVENIIAPALDKGGIILCDRFYDSTTAYQGYGRGIDTAIIDKMNRLAVGKYRPDLTFIIDIDYPTSLKRMKKMNKVADRLESESKAFFTRVRNGFKQISHRNKKRVILLNGKKSIEKIFDEVRHCLRRKLKIG